MISGVVSNTALAQIPAATGIGVKIDTPVDSANLPAGDLTIYGTSSDDDTTNCQVYADWNDLKPMQNVSANGPKGISDFSKWSFTYTSNYHNIIEGQNELTSKITCYESGPSASSKSYSINVTGTKAVSKNSNDTLQQTKEDTVAESSNILSVKSNNNDNNNLNNALNNLTKKISQIPILKPQMLIQMLKQQMLIQMLKQQMLIQMLKQQMLIQMLKPQIYYL